jgi:hypothetical protein
VLERLQLRDQLVRSDLLVNRLRGSTVRGRVDRGLPRHLVDLLARIHRRFRLRVPFIERRVFVAVVVDEDEAVCPERVLSAFTSVTVTSRAAARLSFS